MSRGEPGRPAISCPIIISLGLISSFHSKHCLSLIRVISGNKVEYFAVPFVPLIPQQIKQIKIV